MRLGVANVEQDILRRLTFRQLRGWEHADEIDSLVDVELRMDYRIASIVQMLHNIHRGKGQKALPLKDFVLQFGEPEEKKRQSPEQQFQMLKLLSAMHAQDVPVSKVIDMNPHLAQPLKDVTAAEVSAIEKARAAIKVV